MNKTVKLDGSKLLGNNGYGQSMAGIPKPTAIIKPKGPVAK